MNRSVGPSATALLATLLAACSAVGPDYRAPELELPASDPRSVVRRGAVYARAQVDFRDKDGKDRIVTRNADGSLEVVR